MSTQRLNFCTHALIDLGRYSATFVRDKMPLSALMMQEIALLLERAVKIILPPGGLLFEYRAPTPQDMTLCRLPYPVIAAEFTSRDQEEVTTEKLPGEDGVLISRGYPSKRIVLAVDLASDQVSVPYLARAVKAAFEIGGMAVPPGILCVYLGALEGVWVPYWCLDYVQTEGAEASHYLSFPMGEYGVQLRNVRLRHGDLDSTDTALDVVALIQLCCALNCSNVSVESLPAPQALNKKRAAKGKPPLYEYKTLKVEVPRTASQRPSQGGTHASPRLHIRRGHIRHLPDKAVWVQPHMVGSAKRGVIQKDYQVRASDVHR